jgi:hypothetical protein
MNDIDEMALESRIIDQALECGTIRDDKGTPVGVRCLCGNENRFSVWVYAHWRMKITFTCPSCHAKCTLLRGEIIQ